MKEIISLNPHEDRIIGVNDYFMFFKSEYQDYIIAAEEPEYLRILQLYINSKKDFCNRYNHFCGVHGDFTASEYELALDEMIINEYENVADDGKNDGIEMKKVKYPVYIVHKFDDHSDMEHG